MSGLDHPWDVAFSGNGRMFITERDRGRVVIRRVNGSVETLIPSVPNLWVSGETGLMGIEIDPRFKRNRRFYLCHGYTGSRGGHDVRVTAWKTDRGVTTARRTDNVVTGIQTSSGRHGGCRLRIGGGGALFVGTGDAAITGSARDKSSLAGKVLRVNRYTGNAISTNPFINSDNKKTRKLYTYGHRNVQGLSQRPGGTMFSVEHGTYRDDEVNKLRKGGDYGWQAGPGYDESSPMTDFSLPGPQIGAKWSSGNPTVATSGATWLRGYRWGRWRGRLAVAALKDQSVRIMGFSNSGNLISVSRPVALDDFGRLRSATLGPRNVLYLTTDNGNGNDRVLSVSAIG